MRDPIEHELGAVRNTEASRVWKALAPMDNQDISADLPSAQEMKKKFEELRQQKERLVAQEAETNSKWEAAQAGLKQVRAETESLSSEILSLSREQDLLRVESQSGHAEEPGQVLSDLTAQQNSIEAALTAAQRLKASVLLRRESLRGGQGQGGPASKETPR
jgi:predicted nuclease with TOPRIM domain